MRLTTRVHGFLDYLFAVGLFALPWVAGFGGSLGGAVAMGAGAVILILTLLTNFETGLVKWVEVPVHLWIDGIAGLLLAISPWLLSFDRTVWLPHVAAGVLIILSALITNTVPQRDRRGSRGRN